MPLLSCCRDCVEDFIVLGLPRSPRRKYTRVNIKIFSKRREHPGKHKKREKLRQAARFTFYDAFIYQITILIINTSPTSLYEACFPFSYIISYNGQVTSLSWLPFILLNFPLLFVLLQVIIIGTFPYYRKMLLILNKGICV